MSVPCSVQSILCCWGAAVLCVKGGPLTQVKVKQNSIVLSSEGTPRSADHSNRRAETLRVPGLFVKTKPARGIEGQKKMQI